MAAFQRTNINSYWDFMAAICNRRQSPSLIQASSQNTQNTGKRCDFPRALYWR
jgi:hypothetical protein